ncbi:MAG: tripartite tricarboxylate transporter substrate binding protein [Burkholderiales bacterium]
MSITLVRRRIAAHLALALGLGLACWSGALRAETYPSRPVTLVVSFEAGGSTDVSARVVAQELGRILRQQVVVENRAGAGGRVGTKSVALAKPDGYTLLWGSGSSLTAAPVLYADQGHVATLMPVSLGATQAFVFVTTPAVGARTLAEFVALAKKRPMAMNFASAGNGSSNHLLGEIFMSTAGVQLMHIPYKGSASAREALLKGDAQLMDEVPSPLLAQLKAGQLQPLFVTGDARDPLLPDVPTARELGMPDLVITGFYGLLAPAGTPANVVDTLNAAMKEALASAPVVKAFETLGFTPAFSTPAQMADRISQGKARYERIVRERGIRVE